jgi:hypothetical protein
VIHRHVGFETCVNILVGLVWPAVKNLDGIQTEIPTGFFHKDKVTAVTLLEIESII